MPEDEDINRMTERLDLEQLRESTYHPSRFERAWERFKATILTRTAFTVFLALLIVAVLALGYYLVVA